MNHNRTFTVDSKDRKILYELDANSRQPISKIARKLRLSTEVVNYRIKQLEKNNIITHYQLIVNLAKLNILQFKICLSLQHINSKKLDEIIDVLKQNNAVKWIVSCKGPWNLIISVETDSIKKIDLLKDEVLILFEGHINQKAVSILIEADVYNRDYLIGQKIREQKPRSIMKQNSLVELDELDMSIIKILSENARTPITKIANKLKTTARIVNYRIKQLIKNGIITGFKIALNYEKIGIKFYKAFIYLDNPKDERVKSLIYYLSQHKNVIHHVKVLGNWDLEHEFEVYSEEDFDNILNEIKDNFSDIIKNIDIVTISKEHKFIYF